MRSVTFIHRNFRFFDAPVATRVIYAVVAALLWWAMAEANQALGDDDYGLLYYGTGAVFSAFVLVPYLPGLSGSAKVRAVGLLLCGVLSYWFAQFLLLNDSSFFAKVPWFLLPPDVVHAWRDLVTTIYVVGFAGVYGALIIGMAARWLVPLTLRRNGWLMLTGAGFLGGAVLGISVGDGIRLTDGIDYGYWLPGHLAWQVLVCLALYYGSERTSEARREISP